MKNKFIDTKKLNKLFKLLTQYSSNIIHVILISKMIMTHKMIIVNNIN